MLIQAWQTTDAQGSIQGRTQGHTNHIKPTREVGVTVGEYYGNRET